MPTEIVKKPDSTGTDNDDLDDIWYCIKTGHHKCMCGNFETEFVTVAHDIVVFDDPEGRDIQSMCEVAEDFWGESEIVEYEESLGSFITYWAARAEVERRKGDRKR